MEITDYRFSRRHVLLGPVYTKHQRQRCHNSAMMLAILFSLNTMESLQNQVATHFQVTPLFSMIASVVAELWQR